MHAPSPLSTGRPASRQGLPAAAGHGVLPQRGPQQRTLRQPRLHVEAVARSQGESQGGRLTLTPQAANPASSSPQRSHSRSSPSATSKGSARNGDLVSWFSSRSGSTQSSIPAIQPGASTEGTQQQSDRPVQAKGDSPEAPAVPKQPVASSSQSAPSGSNSNGARHSSTNGSTNNGRGNSNGGGKQGSSSPAASGGPVATAARSSRSPEDSGELQAQLKLMRAALDTANLDRLHAEARAREAELSAQEAHDALAQAQESSSSLSRQYSALCEEIDVIRARDSAEGGSGAAGAPRSADLGRQVDDLQAQLEDLDYRLGWALRDLRAHQLVLRAQGELNMHLSGLPSNMQQQIFEQVDSGAELLGDGGSATVHAITLNGEPLAVKVMPLYDINTARPYHFRDICTTFLRHQRSPYIEMPLHTFLRLKDDEVEGTQYYLYTVWPRRHMDVDQLLCRRSLRPMEMLTIMHHTVLALADLAMARMVHADVKPPNVLVMLGPDGMVQSAHLTDFGSVQFVPPGEDAAPAIWDNQLAWNWPPEQRNFVHLEACDVWGLGLMYSCMKVVNPSKPDVTDVLQDENISAAEFDRVRDTELLPDRYDDPPEIRALTHLMRRCVVRDPAKRPHMKELSASIQQLTEAMHIRLASAAKAARASSL